MITNEMLQVVAEYDGWVKKSEIHTLKGAYYAKEIKGQSKVVSSHLCDFEYDTSMDWLHPVAVTVADELINVFNKSENVNVFSKAQSIYTSIKKTIFMRPINGQYIDLFKAVYEAIIFINQNKETCAKY